jgi:peptide deformylase
MNFKLDHTPVLHQKSEDWNFDSDVDPEKLENDMISFMKQNHGIGLAANQIGLKKRIFVMGSEQHKDFTSPIAMFNPTIIESSKTVIEDTEGCLSYPGLWLKIKRPNWVVTGYYTSQGKYQETKFVNYAAKCFQHELDHLDGICFVDKISQLKLALALKKQRKNR